MPKNIDQITTFCIGRIDMLETLITKNKFANRHCVAEKLIKKQEAYRDVLYFMKD
jgi:hypothetical protein